MCVCIHQTWNIMECSDGSTTNIAGARAPLPPEFQWFSFYHSSVVVFRSFAAAPPPSAPAPFLLTSSFVTDGMYCLKKGIFIWWTSRIIPFLSWFQFPLRRLKAIFDLIFSAYMFCITWFGVLRRRLIYFQIMRATGRNFVCGVRVLVVVIFFFILFDFFRVFGN